MSEAKGAEPRPYHHGDLRRALLEAARRLLESEGPTALSLRAVAREAGVSPAAPYHHFKDKAELLDAVSQLGWDALHAQLKEASESSRGDELNAVGVAYVAFARKHPALYRIMYDAARDKEILPQDMSAETSGVGLVRKALAANGLDLTSPTEVELATLASWCVSHGIAEMVGFRQFDHLKDELGGEEALVSALLRHVRMVPGDTR